MLRLLLPFLFSLPVFLFSQVNPSDITIYRDEYGVPHIYGKTDADAIYGLAWANAEDNFFDMQTNLLISRARYGEVEGKYGAMIDYVVQLVRIRELIDEKYQSDVSEEFKKVLEAYCQSVNTYGETHPEELRVKGLLPIVPEDLLVGYNMSLSLIAGLPFHLINIFEGEPGGPMPYSFRGSNSFAYNSNKTTDGQVYLANNAHQPLGGNTSWYEAHIASEEGLNIMGALFPGGASIFAGANEYLGWAHTVNLSDFVDVYKLTTRKAAGKVEYKYDGEWLELEEFKPKMKVKLGPVKLPISKKAWWSVHGATVKGKDGIYYALRFPQNMGIGAAEQWFRMDKARNFTEFYDLLATGGLPNFNIVYADRNDTIFYIDNGNYPFRDRAFDWLGLLPGDTSAAVWEDYHSIEELVQVLQPSCGYVYNTNNTPFSSSGPADTPLKKDYDPTLHVHPFENNRSLRYQELIAETEKVSYEDFKRIKYDLKYPDSLFVYFCPNMEDLLNLSPEEHPEIAEEIQVLSSWDKTGHKDSEGAGLFFVTLNMISSKALKEREYFKSRSYSEEEFVHWLTKAGEHLRHYFGTVHVTLGEVQRLVRGDVDMPMSGLPDVLAAMHSQKWENGRYQAITGESYIQLIRFSEKGVRMESVVPYGSSNHPDSPHYDDQMGLFTEQKTKTISLEKAWVEEHAQRVYHPGE